MEENINPITDTRAVTFDNCVLKKAFLWMFLGLFATGIISWYTYKLNALLIFSAEGGLGILLIVEVVVVLLFSFISHKLPPIVVGIMFFLYAAINGITLSSIFYIYELNSIISIFFVSAAVFFFFAVLGYTTSIDLSKISNILFGLLLACVIVSVINIFLGNSIIEVAISILVLILFFGVVAYDIQKLKNMEEYEQIYQDKLHIYAAMDFYLDFVNIFLRILSLFGKRKN